MAILEPSDISIQSYFEARSNIRDLELRQFSTIQFFLGTFAAVMGGSIGLMQYVGSSDRPLLAISLVVVSNVLSVSLFFSWCSLTLMINRVASFCLDIININHHAQRDSIWETWIRSDRNKSSVPYLIESTLFVFLLPIVSTFFLSMYFANGTHVRLLFINLLTTIFGALLLLLQYRWVLRQVVGTWAKAESA